MKNVSIIMIASVAAMLASCAQPKLVGPEAEEALSQCLFADFEAMTAMATYRSSGILPEGIRETMAETASLCERVGDIDTSALSLKARTCLEVFPAKAKVYRGTLEVVLTPGATVREGEALTKDIDQMNSLIRTCAAEEPAGQTI